MVHPFHDSVTPEPASPSRRTLLALLGVSLAAAPLLRTPQASAATRAAAAIGLDDPAKKEIAMKLVSSAEIGRAHV